MNYIEINMKKDVFHAAFNKKKVFVFTNRERGISKFIHCKKYKLMTVGLNPIPFSR